MIAQDKSVLENVFADETDDGVISVRSTKPRRAGR
jgi:hypothetical protein